MDSLNACASFQSALVSRVLNVMSLNGYGLLNLFISVYSVFSGSLLLSDDVCPNLDFVSGEIIKIQDRRLGLS